MLAEEPKNQERIQEKIQSWSDLESQFEIVFYYLASEIVEVLSVLVSGRSPQMFLNTELLGEIIAHQKALEDILDDLSHLFDQFSEQFQIELELNFKKKSQYIQYFKSVVVNLQKVQNSNQLALPILESFRKNLSQIRQLAS